MRARSPAAASSVASPAGSAAPRRRSSRRTRCAGPLTIRYRRLRNPVASAPTEGERVSSSGSWARWRWWRTAVRSRSSAAGSERCSGTCCCARTRSSPRTGWSMRCGASRPRPTAVTALHGHVSRLRRLLGDEPARDAAAGLRAARRPGRARPAPLPRAARAGPPRGGAGAVARPGARRPRVRRLRAERDRAARGAAPRPPLEGRFEHELADGRHADARRRSSLRRSARTRCASASPAS